MSYQGKCLYCAPACFFLAIINAVLNGIVVLCLVCTWGMAILFSSGGTHMNIGGVSFKRDGRNRDYDYWMAVFLFIVVPVIALLNLIFSGVLCNGIINVHPRQVKVYFWYGVVNTALTFILLSALFIVDLDFKYTSYVVDHGTLGIYLVAGCVLHSLFLVLVHFTHKQLLEEKIRLEEIETCDIKHLINEKPSNPV